MIDLYALFELIMLLRYFKKKLQNVHLKKETIRQETIVLQLIVFT
jgi:hypothetical protein